jgi:hypothetical protein
MRQSKFSEHQIIAILKAVEAGRTVKKHLSPICMLTDDGIPPRCSFCFPNLTLAAAAFGSYLNPSKLSLA